MAPRTKKKKICSGQSTLQHYFGGKVSELESPGVAMGIQDSGVQAAYMSMDYE